MAVTIRCRHRNSHSNIWRPIHSFDFSSSDVAVTSTDAGGDGAAKARPQVTMDATAPSTTTVTSQTTNDTTPVLSRTAEAEQYSFVTDRVAATTADRSRNLVPGHRNSYPNI